MHTYITIHTNSHAHQRKYAHALNTFMTRKLNDGKKDKDASNGN